MPARAIFLILLMLSLSPVAALAQATEEGAWWPSEWGANDERGAANRITPQKVLQAISLIEEGRIYELGRVYEAGMPVFPGRQYVLTIPGDPAADPLGKNALVGHDDFVSANIGQVGTQFDGLGHVGTRIDGEDVFYNGFKASEFRTENGLERLGIDPSRLGGDGHP